MSLRSDGMNSELFHQRARDCLRLADECPDFYAREALKELAQEFEQMATLVDADARSSDRARSRRDRCRHDGPTHQQPRPR
jgi:hypothetical protein